MHSVPHGAGVLGRRSVIIVVFDTFHFHIVALLRDWSPVDPREGGVSSLEVLELSSEGEGGPPNNLQVCSGGGLGGGKGCRRRRGWNILPAWRGNCRSCTAQGDLGLP